MSRARGSRQTGPSEIRTGPIASGSHLGTTCNGYISERQAHCEAIKQNLLGSTADLVLETRAAAQLVECAENGTEGHTSRHRPSRAPRPCVSPSWAYSEANSQKFCEGEVYLVRVDRGDDGPAKKLLVEEISVRCD